MASGNAKCATTSKDSPSYKQSRVPSSSNSNARLNKKQVSSPGKPSEKLNPKTIDPVCSLYCFVNNVLFT